MAIYEALYRGENEAIGKSAKLIREQSFKGRKTTEDLGSFDETYIPGHFDVIRPEIYEGKIDISLSQDEINQVVKRMGLVESNGKAITEANIGEPNSPFWGHEELIKKLPLKGLRFDDSNILDKFWLDVLANRQDAWAEGLGWERPQSLSQIQWHIVKAGNSKDGGQSKEIKGIINITTKTYGADSSRVKLLADLVYMDTIEMADQEVRNSLIAKVAYEGDTLTQMNTKLSDAFDLIMECDKKKCMAIDLFVRAKSLKVVVFKGGKYLFNGNTIGTSPEDVVSYLSDTANEQTVSIIESTIVVSAKKE